MREILLVLAAALLPAQEPVREAQEEAPLRRRPPGPEGIRERLARLADLRMGEFRIETALRQLFPQEDEYVLAAAGGVRVDSLGPGARVHIRADNVVVWLDREKVDKAGKEAEAPAAGKEQAAEGAAPEGGQTLALEAVRAVYAEGEVTALYGLDEEVRCDRLYYEPKGERALFVNGYLRSSITARRERVPLHVRAEEIRRTSPSVFTARNATVTSCEFGRPHYHLRARELETWLAEDGSGVGGARLRHLTFEARGVPLFYWPALAWGRDESIPLKRVRVGNSSEFGAFVLTDWGADIEFGEGKDRKKWGEWLFDLDVRSRRGLAGGPGLRYKTRDYEGRIQTYFMHDSGEDIEDVPLEQRDRGRARVQHRHWLRLGELGGLFEPAGDVQMDIEAAWISDRGFLNEYFEREFREEKAQETYLRLKKQWDNQALTFTTKYRINRFFTETDELPGAAYHLLSQPVLPEPVLGTNLLVTSDTSWSHVRLNPDEALGIPARDANRLDTENTLAAPLKAGIFRVLPDATGRYTFWSDALREGDEIDRAAYAGGVRAATQFSRVYPTALAGILPIRHVIHPSIGYRNVFAVNTLPERLIPFDATETVREFEAITLRLRNRLQTKLGDTILDFIDLELRQSYFPDDARDNRGRNFGNLEIDFKGAPRRDLFILAEGEFDHYAQDFAVASVGVLATPLPGVTLFAADRLARHLAHIATFNADVRLNEKWSVFTLTQYDFRQGEGLEQRIALRRRFHRWIAEFHYTVDESRDSRSFGISFAPLELYRGFRTLMGAFDTPRLGITPGG